MKTESKFTAFMAPDMLVGVAAEPTFALKHGNEAREFVPDLSHTLKVSIRC